MVRGSGKFKTKRGGGRNFSRNLTPLDADGEPMPIPDKWAARGKVVEEDDEDEESEEESEDSDDDEDGGPSIKPQPGPLAGKAADQPELTRAERRAQKKGKPAGKSGKDNEDDSDEDEEDDTDLINPNRGPQRNTKLADVGTSAPREISRREREAKEKQEAKERYWKLHVQGKTDQAKTDLARLAAIRKEREQAAAQRKAEQAAKEADLEAKKAASRQKRSI